VTDEYDLDSLNPDRFLAQYLKNHPLVDEVVLPSPPPPLTPRETKGQFIKKPLEWNLTTVSDAVPRPQSPEWLKRKESNEVSGNYWSERVDALEEQLSEIRFLLVKALGGEDAVPVEATVAHIADAVRSTMDIYRKLIHRQKAMLEEMVARAESSNESIELFDGTMLLVHKKRDCLDPNRCSIHNPSDHALNGALYAWIDNHMYRMCEHGNEHPDPDDLHFRQMMRGYPPGPESDDPEDSIPAHDCDCRCCLKDGDS
jgi:hypothetical protein